MDSWTSRKGIVFCLERKYGSNSYSSSALKMRYGTWVEYMWVLQNWGRKSRPYFSLQCFCYYCLGVDLDMVQLTKYSIELSGGDHKPCSKLDYCPRKMKICMCICHGILWWIWRDRNERFFKKLHIPPTKVADNIQSIYVWVKHKSSKFMVSWIDRYIHPFN